MIRSCTRTVSGLFLVASSSLFAADGEAQTTTGESGFGRLEAQVRLAGAEIPAATRIENTTDPDACGRSHTLEDLRVDSATRGVADAFAVLEPLSEAREPALAPSAPAKLVLDNVGCRFEPHAAIVPVGTVLEAANSDEVLHTVHLYGPVELNIALPFKGTRVEHQLTDPGVYAVRCDIHGWMQALVRVVDQPYFAVSDRNGRFAIESIPSGEYVLDVWHEKLGSHRTRLDIADGETRTLVVDYTLVADSGRSGE